MGHQYLNNPLFVFCRDNKKRHCNQCNTQRLALEKKLNFPRLHRDAVSAISPINLGSCSGLSHDLLYHFY